MQSLVMQVGALFQVLDIYRLEKPGCSCWNLADCIDCVRVETWNHAAWHESGIAFYHQDLYASSPYIIFDKKTVFEQRQKQLAEIYRY